MRLTLRTLLAYLDNTLEASEIETLRQKLADSGFATQLVQRIRAKLVDPSLVAPSPTAVGPLQDPNVISEYLDSTLPAEQLAEIERACLESDPNLAEVAACHQILTMVLGQPADVPAGLRQRIYELPDKEIEKIAATSEKFSSLTIEPPQAMPPLVDAGPNQVLVGAGANVSFSEAVTLDPPAESPAEPVTPVGPKDSGVSDAPTRLRQTGVIDDAEPRPYAGKSAEEVAMAGAKEFVRDDSPMPWRRITSVLVSIGLAAATVLIVLQIFRPLIIGDPLAYESTEPEPDSSAIPPVVEIPPPAGQPDRGAADENEVAASPGDLLPDPAGELAPRQPIGEREIEPGPVTTIDVAANPEAVRELLAPDAVMVEVDSADTTAMAEPDASVASLPAGQPVVPDLVDGDAEALPAAVTDLAGEAEAENGELIVGLIDATRSISTLLDPGGNWLRMGSGAWAVTGSPVVVAPKFRATMAAFPSAAVPIGRADQEELAKIEPDYQVELLGATGVRWLKIEDAEQDADPSGAVIPQCGLEVDFGQIIVKGAKSNTIVPLKLADATMEITLTDEGTEVAAALKRNRAPGSDPFTAGNRQLTAQVYCVSGQATIRHNDQKLDLVAGQVWRLDQGGSPVASTLDETPSWIQTEVSKLDRNAMARLLELVNKDSPIESLLREATLFRQSEVAALAAQSLLTLGQADVFFGTDGILNQPKQRQHWTEHFDLLISAMDRSAESANLVRDAVTTMDAANQEPIIRLLTGYSQAQLESGGAKELVEFLDAESMAVRVLAIKNLRRITGGTMFYRADEPVPARRADAIKKWNIRLQRDLIRWQESP